MKVQLALGAELDILTKKELGEELRAAHQRWQQQVHAWELGKKHQGLPVARGVADGSGHLTLGSTTDPDQVYLGPREGFVWQVVRVSVGIMASSDVLAIYKGEPGNGHFVAELGGGPGGGVFTPSRGLLLKPGDYLVLSTQGLSGSLTAGTSYAVSGEVYQVPAEMVGKLID